MMNQGVLPFKYESTENDGFTSLAGLPTFFELASVLGLLNSLERHVCVHASGSTWYAPNRARLTHEAVVATVEGAGTASPIQSGSKKKGFEMHPQIELECSA